MPYDPGPEQEEASSNDSENGLASTFKILIVGNLATGIPVGPDLPQLLTLGCAKRSVVWVHTITLGFVRLGKQM
jgi:hypothetical protein